MIFYLLFSFAYVEFLEKDGVDAAVRLKNDVTFKGRQIKVNAKRTNVPGMHRGGFGGMGGMPPRGRGGFRGNYRGGRARGRGRGFNPY